MSFLKKLIAFFIALIFGQSAAEPVIINKPNAIYVDSVFGSELGDGSVQKPVNSISAALEMVNDDKNDIFIIRGTYNECITVNKSGVTIEGAENSNAVISGAEKVNGEWEKFKGGIYRIGLDDDVSGVFVDGCQMNIARWPNTGTKNLCNMQRASAEDGTNSTVLFDKSLPKLDLSGAMLAIWPGGEWTAFSREISGCDAGKSISWSVPVKSAVEDNPEGMDCYVPESGDPYYVYGLLGLLDYPGEWFYDSAGKMLYLYAPCGRNPNSLNVEYKKRSMGISINSDNVTVKNIGVFGCGVECFGSNCTLDKVDVKYSDYFLNSNYFEQNEHIFTRLDGKNNIWKNSEIAYASGNGIYLCGENNTVENCHIHDCCASGSYYGCISENGTGNTIRRCTLNTSGRYLLYHNGKNLKLLESECFNACLLSKDCGAAYTWGTDGGGTEFAYNYFHDNREVAIYLDNNCSDYYVHDNLITDNGTGITMNSQALGHRVENNIFLRNDKLSSTYCYDKDVPSMAGTVISGNIYMGKWQLVGGEFAPDFSGNKEVKTSIGVQLPDREYGCNIK